GELYQTNAEIGSLEAQIRFVIESRNRLQSQLTTLDAQRAQWLQQDSDNQEQLSQAEMALEEFGARVEQTAAAAGAQAERLPELEQAWRGAQDKTGQTRARVMQIQ